MEEKHVLGPKPLKMAVSGFSGSLRAKIVAFYFILLFRGMNRGFKHEHFVLAFGNMENTIK